MARGTAWDTALAVWRSRGSLRQLRPQYPDGRAEANRQAEVAPS
jgi:hypothetical protein